MSFVFLDPRQKSKFGLLDPAKRLTTLRGKRIGILWNNRPCGDALLRNVAEALNAKYGLEDVYFTKKTFIGNAAPDAIIEELAARVDAAIVGVGD
jgi:hypothetical protein